jgi:predicted nucleic acid-binding protein
MRISLDIQEGKADAFLNFIKTLDFVSVAEDVFFSEEQKQELDHRMKTAKEKDFISLDEANKMLATKYGL